MPAKQDIPVNHTILRWARKQTLLSSEEIVRRANIKELRRRGLSAKERLKMWEDGDEKPTLNQLEHIAKVYRRPILTFFLAEPPLEVTNLSDFRTVGDHAITKSTPEFAAFRRRLEALQREVRLLVEAEEGAKLLPFIGSVNMKAKPDEVCESIRSVLDLPFSEQREYQRPEELFNTIRNRAGEAGIFILRKADLGSKESKISVEEFRGLTISDSFAPFIVINPNDAKSALLFSLVHELTHLWLGESGISNYDALRISQSAYQEREVFCNKVAAEFLVPEVTFKEEWQKVRGEVLYVAIRFLKDKFNVSRVVIARRLLDFQKIEPDLYWDLYNQWKAEMPSTQKRRKSDGPGYFVREKSKLGKKLIATVIGAAYEGRLSYGSASRLLGIKIGYFDKFYKG